MFSLIRNGPDILLLNSSDVPALKSFFMSRHGALDYDFDTAFDKATEAYTILFLSDEMKPIIERSDIREVLIVKKEANVFLCSLISEPPGEILLSVRTAPRILLLRAIGNLKLVMDRIQGDLGGELGDFMALFNSGNSESTLVSITDKPLNRTCKIGDLFEKTLKLDGNHHTFSKELRMHALKYLNAGIDNQDWNEIEIRIFDRYSAYSLHYDRLIELFESLELGIVLGESWSKDYPRLFMSVEVYRVRFFTFHDPLYIKRLLLGMEYTEDGMRIVDYDVYFNQKKIDWTEAILKNDPRSRALSGLVYRKLVYDKLGSTFANELLTLESQVLKTRI